MEREQVDGLSQNLGQQVVRHFEEVERQSGAEQADGWSRIWADGESQLTDGHTSCDKRWVQNKLTGGHNIWSNHWQGNLGV